MSAIFLLPVCLTYWPRKYTTRVDPHVDNSHHIWSWYDQQLPSYSVFVYWYVMWPCDLDLLTLDRCHTWQVTWPTCHQLWRPLPIRSWVISYNVSRWLPLKMRTRPCACAESRDPCVGGQKQLHFWYAGLRFACSLCNFGGSTMKVIKIICENNARPCVKWRMSFSAC